jgi:ubiquinone biosynthesis accessory factor UbiJ
MIHALTSAVQTALVERLTLLLNHVLGAEPVATDRLRGHAGRIVRLHFDGWPALLPPLPSVAYRVTPAGLLEAFDATAGSGEPDLRMCVDATNPALAVAQWSASGELPRVEVQGDAQFAADLSWLIENLRWDVQDDVARLVGHAPAHELARIGRLLAGGLRVALGALAGGGSRGGGSTTPARAGR